MSRMLREIVTESLSSAPDLEVAREYDQAVDLAWAVQRDRADVVVAAKDVLSEEEIEHALREAPRLKVLGLADDGRQLLLYELAPQRFEVGEASPRLLREVIRSGRAWGKGPPRPGPARAN